jgi:Fe-S cluster biosynthesis and repair protein YggX
MSSIMNIPHMLKKIRIEQWTVKELIHKIDNNEISKPRFQRKKKWDKHPKNRDDSKPPNPNEREYIEFLYETENSVHPITFGQESTPLKIRFSNIDGNNRINALKYFVVKPFKIFPEYLKDIEALINSLHLSEEDKETLKDIFKNLSYNEIINFKYKSYFIENGHADLYKKIQIYRDTFEPVEDKLKTRLKIRGEDNFDTCVKINVNLFEGYTIDELCKIFEDINKYNTKLTETELLASQLFNETNFEIIDETHKAELEKQIKKYYISKAEGEVLECYTHDTTKPINAHEFIVGFQNYCNEKYKDIIEKNDEKGVGLYYKIWKALYLNFTSTFTTENVNDFLNKITDACCIFNETIESIFTCKINDKLFNKSCKEKMKSLKKNNIYVIITAIIGFRDKNTDRNDIINNISKCLLYHFMVNDLKNKDNKEVTDNFKLYDSITYIAGGGHIDALTKNILSDPCIIIDKLTDTIFKNLIDVLYSENNNPHEINKSNKRRTLKFFEKILMLIFYKEKMPSNLLKNEFSLEHIIPYSCEYEGDLDIDRIGNLVPITVTMNSSRGNKHIDEYYKTADGKDFCKFIIDIIPKSNEYDKIVAYNKNKKNKPAPVIINNELYNNMCAKNEETYKQNFIDCMFKKKK